MFLLLRDLFDLLKDNIQIKESKVHGILLSGVTEVSLIFCSQFWWSKIKGIISMPYSSFFFFFSFAIIHSACWSVESYDLKPTPTKPLHCNSRWWLLIFEFYLVAWSWMFILDLDNEFFVKPVLLYSFSVVRVF